MKRSLLILLLCMLPAAGCETPQANKQGPFQSAEEAWTYHLGIVERAVATKSVFPEFADSSEVLEEVTGIQVRGDGDYVGWHATNETAEDLEQLRVWYEKNSGRLVWNEESQTFGLSSR